jgi:uncharacterized protein (TIGR02452 family)
MAYPAPSYFQQFVPLGALKRSLNTYPAIARENINIYEAGQYTNQADVVVRLPAVDHDTVPPGVTYPPTYKFTIPRSGSLPGEIEVTSETTIGATRRLIEIEGEPNTVALNFANPMDPGGGFTVGAVAQEEALCRCSTLYNFLEALPAMYENYRRNRWLFTDYMSLVRDVPIFRDDEYDFLERPFFASFITCAAPVASKYLSGKGDPKQLYTVLETRVKKIVQCAIQNGFTNAVFGAFGAGAFGNNSKDVAMVFRKVLID